MNIVNRVKSLLLNPKNEWDIIKNESYSIQELFKSYIIIVAAIPAVAGFLGFFLFGVSTAFGSYRMPLAESLKWAILTYVMTLVSVFVVGYIVDVLAPQFGSKKNLAESIKLVAFANTAAWVGGIFNLLPSLSIVATLAGIYSLVLLYMGLPKIKDIPQEKVTGYFIVIIIVAIVVSIVVGGFVASIVFGSEMSSFINQ